eukprot:3769153-Rhodomonas_salina.7
MAVATSRRGIVLRQRQRERDAMSGPDMEMPRRTASKWMHRSPQTTLCFGAYYARTHYQDCKRSQPIVLRARYAKSGTEIGHQMRSPVLT